MIDGEVRYRCGELSKDACADANDDGQNENFDAAGDDVSENALGEECGLATQGKGHKNKSRECREFELDEGDEELNREEEECEDHEEPRQGEDEDLVEIQE